MTAPTMTTFNDLELWLNENRVTEVECLGACVNAPILQVNDDFYEDMDAEKTKALIEALQRGEIPKPGSMSGRQTSAPDGGPITLTTLSFAKAQ